MSLVDRQRAGREIGRIRMGTTVPAVSQKNTTFDKPITLDTWRLTSRNEHLIQAAAALWGGTVQHLDSVGWEVITEATELPVLIPPTAEIINEAFELWEGSECKRRCVNGEATVRIGAVKSASPCLCPADIEQRMELAKTARACKPVTRLNLIIPDLPDLGVWRLQSGGYDANAELSEMGETLRQVRDAGVMMPARLWMDKRVKVTNKQTHRWTVPMLSVSATLRELSYGIPAMEAVMPPEPLLAIAAAVPESGTVRPGNQDTPSQADAVQAHTEAWAGPTVTPGSPAQEIADKASTAGPAVLAALRVRAEEHDWLTDMVTVEGADEELGGYLDALLAKVAVP